MVNKLLLALIAAGLWANVLTKAPARADMSDSYLSGIAHDIHSIYSGSCSNSKLC